VTVYVVEIETFAESRYKTSPRDNSDRIHISSIGRIDSSHPSDRYTSISMFHVHVLINRGASICCPCYREQEDSPPCRRRTYPLSLSLSLSSCLGDVALRRPVCRASRSRRVPPSLRWPPPCTTTPVQSPAPPDSTRSSSSSGS
jgi:hypothetical protein